MNAVAAESYETITAERRDAFSERMVHAVADLFMVAGVYLGDRLEFFGTLARDGALTASELADRCGCHPRYVREWLEHQAVSGVLAVEDESRPAEERRYFLPEGHDEVLADQDSLNYLAPLAQAAVGSLHPLDRVAEVFRNGQGLPFEAYGPDMRQGQARLNRALFLNCMGSDWLPAMPDVADRLEADPRARVADIGCGCGHSSVAIAQAYPKVLVDGFDLDRSSIEEARANAWDAGIAERVQFYAEDAAAAPHAEGYDLVSAFECIHDMPDPVGVLRTVRRLVKPGGAVLVMDERVNETFSTDPGVFERMMYGFSFLHCLPGGMCGDHPAGTGTVMRPATLRRYAVEAGFSRVETLPIENAFFRFYRLHP